MLALIFTVIAMGGGWIFAMIFFAIATISNPKPKAEEKKSQLNINILDRYLLYNLKDNTILASSNDYQKAFKLKTQLGSGVMIKDTKFVKKRRI